MPVPITAVNHGAPSGGRREGCGRPGIPTMVRVQRAVSESDPDASVSCLETMRESRAVSGAPEPRRPAELAPPPAAARPVSANPLASADLAAFAAAVEAGGVRGAADALDLTPSAVTKRIQNLERRLGVRLFDRGRYGLRQTEAGRVLYPEAKQALLALAAAEAAVSEQRAAGAGAMRLAASHTVGEVLLPGWLAAFRAMRPASRVQVDVVNSAGVIAALREGTVELGFVEGRDPLAGLAWSVVRQDELVVVVAAGHRWARRRVLGPRELAGEPWLAREPGSGTRAVAAAALAAAGVELEPALEVASTQSVKRALTAGGFAVLSSLVVQAEVAAGALHAIRVRDVDLTRNLRMIHDPGAPPTGLTADFAAWLTGGAH
jgi:DNA-binding transcriptional LysR family regulator